jgi:hypothetical protein
MFPVVIQLATKLRPVIVPIIKTGAKQSAATFAAGVGVKMAFDGVGVYVNRPYKEAPAVKTPIGKRFKAGSKKFGNGIKHSPRSTYRGIKYVGRTVVQSFKSFGLESVLIGFSGATASSYRTLSRALNYSAWIVFGLRIARIFRQSDVDISDIAYVVKMSRKDKRDLAAFRAQTPKATDPGPDAKMNSQDEEDLIGYRNAEKVAKKSSTRRNRRASDSAKQAAENLASPVDA